MSRARKNRLTAADVPVDSFWSVYAGETKELVIVDAVHENAEDPSEQVRSFPGVLCFWPQQRVISSSTMPVNASF
jgi:hypothetical protein